MNIAAGGHPALKFALTEASLGLLKRLARDGGAAKFWRQRKVSKVDLYLGGERSRPPAPEGLLRDMALLLSAFGGVRLSLAGFPYCFLGENLIRSEYLVRNRETPGAFKAASCSRCAFAGRCAGFPSDYRDFIADRGAELAVPDRPIEVMVEVEARCQFGCRYCFNQNTFAPGSARPGKHASSGLSQAAVKGIVDQLAAWGVPRMRFTGGEPLLRTDLAELMDYAVERGVAVWINTNGYQLRDRGLAKAVCRRADNVLVSLRGWDAESDAAESRHPGSFEASCAGARALRAAGLKTLRVGVCATRSVIRNLDRVCETVKALGADRLEFYRPVAVDGKAPEADAADLKILVDKLTDYRRAGELNAYIANPLPFCFYDADKVSEVSLGAVLGEGNSRFAVDPRGFCKPGYYMNVNMGSCGDLRAAWASPFSRAIRGQELLPERCAGCFYAGKCRGGSRHAAWQAFGDHRAPDPLATFMPEGRGKRNGDAPRGKTL